MKDSKKKSITEALANIVIGYPVNHTSNIFILLPFAPHLAEVTEKHGALSLETQLTIGAMGMAFTVVSIARQYTLRRLFNRLGPNANAADAMKWLSFMLKEKLKRIGI